MSRVLLNLHNKHKFSGITRLNVKQISLPVPDGLAVRIPGSHPGGPGSTPGLGSKLLHRFALFKYLFAKVIKNRPWQDSNLQSSDPKSDALSIGPPGLV